MILEYTLTWQNVATCTYAAVNTWATVDRICSTICWHTELDKFAGHDDCNVNVIVIGKCRNTETALLCVTV